MPSLALGHWGVGGAPSIRQGGREGTDLGGHPNSQGQILALTVRQHFYKGLTLFPLRSEADICGIHSGEEGLYLRLIDLCITQL